MKRNVGLAAALLLAVTCSDSRGADENQDNLPRSATSVNEQAPPRAAKSKRIRSVSCAAAGVVVEVFVAAGEIVKKGDKLLTLGNNDIAVQVEYVLGQRRTTLARIQHLDRTLAGQTPLSQGEWARITREKGELRRQVRALQAQYDRLQRLRSKLTVLSPVDGRVITLDVEKGLLSRPVSPGQILIELAIPGRE